MEFNIKVKKDNEFFVRGIKGKIYDSYKSVGIEVFLDDNAQKLVEKIASENAKKAMLASREMDKN